VPAQAGKKRKKRKRGGKTAAQRNASKAAFEQREAQRSRQAELEARTGDEGLFAFLNSKIGDASEAAAVQRAGGGEPEGAGAGAPGKNAHLFARQPAKGANGAAAAAAKVSCGWHVMVWLWFDSGACCRKVAGLLRLWSA